MGPKPGAGHLARPSAAAVVCALGLLAARTASPAPLPAAASVARTPPLQARLDVPLDSRRTTVGTPVFAAAMLPWPGPDCSLNRGGVISGHIVAAQPRHGSTAEAEVAVLFDRADCNGLHAVPVQLLLYAVVEPEESGGAVMRDRSGLFGSISPHPVYGGGSTTAPVAAINTADAVRTDVSGGLSRSDAPQAVRAGQVIGEDHVEIGVGSGPEGSSRIHSNRRDFRIATGATLVLVVPPRVHSDAAPVLEEHARAGALAEPAASAPLPLPPPPADQTELCEADCSNFSGQSALTPARSAGSADAPVSIPVAQFGYHPTSHPEISGLDHETTLNFLADGQLLLTFDPHRLRERVGEPWHAGTRRTVRAVLLDATSRRVTRALDWQVDDDGQYLWRAGAGRVVVHMRGGLHLFGAGLKELAVLPARGDLLWVAASPRGDRIAFALRRERHDRQTHELIQRLSGSEPEEDVEVRLADEAGNVLLTRSGASGAAPPVLTDSGELIVGSAGVNRWTLFEQGFDGKRLRTLATLNSDCVPEVSAPMSGAFFVVGCAAQGSRWFRVLRQDGRTLLKSRPSMEEVEQTALAGGRDEFAVRVVTLAHATSQNEVYSAAELESERVIVHRERDGKPLFAATELRFPPSRDTYALSPDGTRLALMTRTSAEIYNVLPSP